MPKKQKVSMPETAAGEKESINSVCPVCLGTGGEDKSVPCSKCEGTGKVK